jgi:anti-anti-sigma factor
MISEGGAFVCKARHAMFVVRETGRRVQLEIHGEYDLSCADAAKTTSEHVAERLAKEMTTLVVKLSETTFFDAAGIAFLLRLENIARLTSAEYRVEGASTTVRRLLDIVELDHVLASVPGEEASA